MLHDCNNQLVKSLAKFLFIIDNIITNENIPSKRRGMVETFIKEEVFNNKLFGLSCETWDYKTFKNFNSITIDGKPSDNIHDICNAIESDDVVVNIIFDHIYDGSIQSEIFNVLDSVGRWFEKNHPNIKINGYSLQNYPLILAYHAAIELLMVALVNIFQIINPLILDPKYGIDSDHHIHDTVFLRYCHALQQSLNYYYINIYNGHKFICGDGTTNGTKTEFSYMMYYGTNVKEVYSKTNKRKKNNNIISYQIELIPLDINYQMRRVKNHHEEGITNDDDY